MTLEEALKSADLGPALREKVEAILGPLKRIEQRMAGRKVEDATIAPKLNSDQLRAEAYAAAMNKAGRRMRNCREPEKVPTITCDAVLPGGMTLDERMHEESVGELYAQSCRKHWRK